MANFDEAAWVMEIMEHYAQVYHSEEYPNKLNDFKTHDIVHCSLFTGVYKVTAIGSKKVHITDLRASGEVFPVSPKYLKKLSNKTARILFES